MDARRLFDGVFNTTLTIVSGVLIVRWCGQP
jgi:hypothetical protein